MDARVRAVLGHGRCTEEGGGREEDQVVRCVRALRDITLCSLAVRVEVSSRPSRLTVAACLPLLAPELLPSLSVQTRSGAAVIGHVT